MSYYAFVEKYADEKNEDDLTRGCEFGSINTLDDRQ